MKQKTKRIIRVCFVVLLAVALCAWYFFPVYAAKLFFYKFDAFRKYVEITPVEITALKPPPKEWTTISIGRLILMVPMSRYRNGRGSNVRSIYSDLCFKSEMGSLIITDILRDPFVVPPPDHLTPYQLTGYQWELAICKSTPADISIFNSRSKNMRAFRNQICKALGVPLGGTSKVLVVNTGTLKAICNISEKRKKGYTAKVHAFNQNETVSVNVWLMDYKEVGLLESDLLRILAGIRMPDHRPSISEVEGDIKSIVAKFKKKT